MSNTCLAYPSREKARNNNAHSEKGKTQADDQKHILAYGNHVAVFGKYLRKGLARSNKNESEKG